ncbi:MAG: L-histidine N(alpha)-methyltransferase [Acidimicrobiales bacterium]
MSLSPSASPSSVRVDVHLDADDLTAALRADVLAGLTSAPKELPPKWFYDDRGSDLFDQITRLSEYYPTSCEREILHREAGTVADRSQADTLVELGSGTSEKTLALLDAFVARGRLRRFVPLDVNESFLRASAGTIAQRYPAVAVHGVVGDFEHHLDRIPTGGRRLTAFLGGTVGNLNPAERKRFFADLVDQMVPGDGLLLGTDLVKDPARLVRAYDDAAGVTAEFNRNVLSVVNRELGADFDLHRFEHVARWDATEEWIEMRLRSTASQSVRVEELGLTVTFAEGEEMRTEVSAKFRREGVVNELAGVGLSMTDWWTDAAGDFAVSLSFLR